jgi:hypothetical protein
LNYQEHPSRVGLQGFLLTELPQGVLPQDQPQGEEVNRDDSSDNSVNILNRSNVLVFIVRVPTFLVLMLFYLTKINLNVLFSNVDILTNKCN